ncbi:carboxypeptidase-like regulatory domain-containing protein [Alloacidobacterium sp.]|uniref:carboxypeptidase-like regulatory domain-containing protein n=1 Tax=Alloacidobacterium sp. TaxID=2951999 RepID=UPI002D4B4EEC|nr:carboxypeptidase-like regulatory domain-containing protein [Alloacidobacterium sp.]HYK36076.1 carboxypeptidase-like regulatory domain-containing protein [Alloacidobacterium sp.]
MRAFLRGIVSAFLRICGLIVVALPLQAQSTSNSGTVSGTVTDPTGAVVPAATISIRNAVSQYERTTATNQAGFFQFTNVPFNSYQLTVTMTGFSSASQEVKVASVVP